MEIVWRCLKVKYRTGFEGEVLTSPLSDDSAVRLLQDMNKLTPPDEVKAKYMKHTFANTIGPINEGAFTWLRLYGRLSYFFRTSDIVQPAFEAIEKEVKFILSVRRVRS